MFSVCELCDVVVEKVFIKDEDEYGCESCWNEYGEIHQKILNLRRVCLTDPLLCAAHIQYPDQFKTLDLDPPEL